MGIKTLEEVNPRNTQLITGYAYKEEAPQDRKQVYTINKSKKLINYFPYSDKYLFFDRVILHGYDSLPEVFKKNGFCKNKLVEILNKGFKDKGIKTINVTRSGSCQIIKRGKDKHLYITYKSLLTLSEKLGSADYYHNQRKSQIKLKHFNEEFPKLIKYKPPLKSITEIKESIRTLMIQGVDGFESEDIENITNLLSSLMKSNHRSQITRSALFRNTKLKIDSVTLDQVIDEFEKKINKNTAESAWGKFLESNLFLIDSKYIHALPQLNLVLAGARKVDFGLIDTQGYLDLFEIKKPETKLLSNDKDGRGNYVWDRQAIEAIVQAEKYLLHAESKRNDLKADIKRERQITLDVIRPRAFVIMGNSSQLNCDDKKEDFRILKNQFKNVEIILYDELLDRIKNQKKSLA